MAPVEANEAAASGEERAPESDEQRILSFARSQGEFSRRDVEHLLDCGPTKAKGLVGSLLKQGLIVARGVGRSTRYVLR